MARPGIIIGLGGTGQWVLTFVKKDLLEVGRGKIPPNVALLAFDTMPQATAETERQGGEREVKVGSVKLETDKEFIHVGGNAFRLAQKVSDGQYLHIGSWFQADHYLRSLPPAAFNLSEGAGAIRQFGRLAIFHDLAQPAESRISPNVYNAIQRVRATVTDDAQLEIIIVGSFAGGTGAGMFIDMALLLRSIATEAVAGNHIVRGFFVLPRAFPVGQGRRQSEMFARTFGAWRELNRFMIVDPDLGLKKMIYHERHRDFQVDIEKRAYDVCYLIDAVGGRGNLAMQDPEEGIFPSIADAIGAILDEKAGKKYTEHVTANLSRAFNRHAGQPMYSTMGTYAVKVPVYYVQQEFAHELSLNMMERVLAPVRDEKGRVTGLMPNANPENPGYTGADEVYNFLKRASFSRAGEGTIYNTLFLPKVAELIEKDADTNADTQQAWAEATLHARRGAAPVGWDAPFTQLGDSPEAVELRDEIERVIRRQLVSVVPPSRRAGDKPADAVPRLRRQIPEFKIEQVGVRDAVSEMVSRGKFGEALEKCKGFQVELFQKMLRLWLLNTLEGQVEDPLVARAGKLGYAESFLTELVNVLDRFLVFMRKVKKKRDDSGLANKIAADVQRKHQMYVQRANKKRLLDVVTKGDYQAQERYLAAEQRAIWLRQDEILHEVVEEAAQEILAIARRARDEVRFWVNILALNSDSVLARLSASLDEVRVAHKREQDLKNVQRLLADERYPVGEDKLRDALGKLHWSVERQNGQLSISASLELAQKGDLRTSPRESVDLLLNYASEQFPLFLEKSVAVEMDRVYESDAKRIAGELDKKAEPLTRVSGDGPEERHCYIRVHSDINERVKQTFDDVLETLKGLNQGMSMNLVESDDPFKLTIVRSNDMIRPQDFTAWEECMEKYEELIHDEPEQAILLQAFPPEVLAAKYERKLEELQKVWRIFHPRVVMLLEDEQRLRLFLKAWSYGFIRQAVAYNASKPHYELVLSPSDDRPIHLTNPEHEHPAGGNDIFLLLNQFIIKGKDVRKGLRQNIRYDWLEESIREEEKRLGRDGAAHILEEQYKQERDDTGRYQYLNPEGFVPQQRAKARDLDNRKPGEGQPYSDLADLSELMLRDMVAELRV